MTNSNSISSSEIHQHKLSRRNDQGEFFGDEDETDESTSSYQQTITESVSDSMVDQFLVNDDDDENDDEMKGKDNDDDVETVSRRMHCANNDNNNNKRINKYINNSNALKALPFPSRSILKKETTTSTTRSSAVSRGKVHFEKVVVRTYAMEIGDHPSCSCGPPVQLSWECLDQEQFDVDLFELERIPRRKQKCRFLCMNYYKRVDILRHAGYSEADIEKASRLAAKAKQKRLTTKVLSPLMHVEHAVRSAGRKIKRAATGSKKKTVLSN